MEIKSEKFRINLKSDFSNQQLSQKISDKKNKINLTSYNSFPKSNIENQKKNNPRRTNKQSAEWISTHQNLSWQLPQTT